MLCCFRIVAAAALVATAARAPAAAAAVCEVTQGGVERTLSFAATGDPYRVPPVDVTERFRFKAVLLTGAQGLQSLSIYTSYRVADRHVPLQQARYGAAQLQAGAGFSSGDQHPYAPGLGQEFAYRCVLGESGE